MAAKRSTRRKAGTRTEIPLYLDSDVHVMRENHEGKLVTTVVAGGVLVDDTDLTSDEIDELTARRVIRHATPEEVERLNAADESGESGELAADE